jgi:hypothetical protein
VELLQKSKPHFASSSPFTHVVVDRKRDLSLLQPFIDAAYSVLPQPSGQHIQCAPAFHRSFERRILGPHEAEENYFVC